MKCMSCLGLVVRLSYSFRGFNLAHKAGGSTISHGAASLVRMGRGGARGGLRFGTGARAR